MTDKKNTEETPEEEERVKALKEANIAIITECSTHVVGGKMFYRIVGKHTDSDDEFEALGEDRSSALRSLLVASAAASK